MPVCHSRAEMEEKLFLFIQKHSKSLEYRNWMAMHVERMDVCMLIQTFE